MNHLRGILHALIVILSFSFSVSGQAVPEDRFGVVYDLLAQGEGSFHKSSSFVTPDKKKITFTRFGTQKGSAGTLVILPGRTESSLKYIEVAYDMIEKGFSPVFVIDHRGQGLSQRELEDSHKGHISDFAKYNSDFEQFLARVKKDPKTDQKKLFALSHSMGGSILLNHLAKHPRSFKAVAMIAPLFRIQNAKSEDQILQETFFACYVQFRCDDYIPDGGPFRWENRHFEDNDVTHSFTRFSLRDHLWRTWPKLQLGDPTIRWVRETVLNNRKQRLTENLTPVTVPMQIYQAELDKVVANPAQSEVCGKIGSSCKLFKVLGARHEILMETDRPRSAALTHIEKFFKSR